MPPSPLHPHPFSDASFLPCLHPSFFLSFLFILPLFILLHPLISTNAVASFHPYFPSSLSLTPPSLSPSVFVLCALQPVKVCYCSSSSSPSWLRLVLWCQQPRAVPGWEGLKLPCCSTGCRQPPLSLPTLSPNSPGGTMTLPRYGTLLTEWWGQDYTWITHTEGLLLLCCCTVSSRIYVKDVAGLVNFVYFNNLAIRFEVSCLKRCTTHTSFWN